MASPLTVYKLTVLYLLDRAGRELSQSFVSSFLLENGYANLLNLMQTYDEMAANGLISVTEEDGAAFLAVTADGRESLSYFRSELSSVIRTEADAYLKNNGVRIRREKELTGSYYRRPSADYAVTVAVMENEQPVIELTLSVPDEAAARRVIENWKTQSGEIYRITAEKLF